MAELDSHQTGPASVKARVDAAVDRWQSELLDLSRANRLLYLSAKRPPLSLIHPSPLNLFDGLVNQSRSFTIYRPDETQQDATPDQQLALVLSGDAADGNVGSQVEPPARPPRPDEVQIAGDSKKIDAALYRLRLRARSALLEQGVNVLYATFGTLRWKESDASESTNTSPLLLVAVRLDRETALQPYRLTPLDEQPILNPALVFKLRSDFQVLLELADLGESDANLHDLLGGLGQAVSGQRGWGIDMAAHLGLFSFAKHAMYADLATNRDRLTAHALVRAVAGEDDAGLVAPADIPTGARLDKIPPGEVFQVLDADGSQRAAIEMVKKGVSLVIHGPPGTGKSQTITNVIAEALAQDKTVLFVSEKMAALRVVAKRLEEVGLKQFCLEAHSQGLDKAHLIRDLASTLEAGPVRRAEPSEQQYEGLARSREALSAYVRALHYANNPLARSAYQIHGEVAQRSDAPRILFDFPDIGAPTQRQVADMVAITRALVRVADVVVEADAHPWRGCILKQFSPSIRATLEDRLIRLSSGAAALGQVQAQLRVEWGLEGTSSVAGAAWLRDTLRHLVPAPSIPTSWLGAPSLGPLHSAANHWRARMGEYGGRRHTLLTRYRPELLAADLPILRDALDARGAPYSDCLKGSGSLADAAVARRDEIQRAISVC